MSNNGNESTAKVVKRDSEGREYSGRIYKIQLNKIQQKSNSRATYDKNAMLELMTSMKTHGLYTPVGVTKAEKDGEYELVFGNRRFTAAKKLDWPSIEAVIVEAEAADDKVIVNAIENMQRSDVPLPQQGRMFDKLIREHNLTPDEIAVRVGISKKKVLTAVDLFRRMPEEFRERVTEGTAGQRVKGGKIPVRTAHIALRVAEKYHLNPREKKELFTYATKDNVAGEHLNVVSGLLSAGKKLESAVREADNMRIVTISVALKRAQADRLEKNEGKSIYQILADRLAEDRTLGVTLVRRRAAEKD